MIEPEHTNFWLAGNPDLILFTIGFLEVLTDEREMGRQKFMNTKFTISATCLIYVLYPVLYYLITFIFVTSESIYIIMVIFLIMMSEKLSTLGFFEMKYFEMKAMTSKFLSITSSTIFHYVTQFII